jgi:hypothetical protein
VRLLHADARARADDAIFTRVSTRAETRERTTARATPPRNDATPRLKIHTRGDMSASPAKRAAEDVCPGVRTPTDASPETSAATPEDGERRARRKRGRSSTDDGAGTRGGDARDGGRDLTSSGARREAMREERVRAIRVDLREIAGGMVDALRGKRRGGCVRRRRSFKSDASRERETRFGTRGVRGAKTDDETLCARVMCRYFDGDARTSALMHELTRVERCASRVV